MGINFSSWVRPEPGAEMSDQIPSREGGIVHKPSDSDTLTTSNGIFNKGKVMDSSGLLNSQIYRQSIISEFYDNIHWSEEPGLTLSRQRAERIKSSNKTFGGNNQN
jgi:hypothetical protein